MKIVRRTVDVTLGVPDSTPTPTDDEIDASMASVFDVISKEEFDTLEDHPSWDFLAARVRREPC